ncbi:MAG: hypothetical protein KAJ19_08600, partial [Gammaproteobacteria bacterium]|nr:hypothetical protein [Gammaproteobacteria bacterium]
GFVGNDLGATTNCFSRGSVKGTKYVGGFAGSISSIVTNCYSTGSVEGETYTGGFCAAPTSLVHEINCFWDIETSGITEGTRGTGLTTAQMQTLSTFVGSGWDFLDESANGTGEVWHMPVDGGYPELCFHNLNKPVLLEGAGTRSDPYLVGTPEEFGMIRWYPVDACFQLVNDVNFLDIDLSEAVVPAFNGSFDGNGHTVYNLNISGSGYLGAFGYLGRHSQINDLHLVNITMDSGGNTVGGLVGFNKGALNNCSVMGTITGGDYTDFYGGLIGYNDKKGKVSNCHTVTDVLCGYAAYNTGGLLGRNYFGEVFNCSAVGAVIGQESAGGFVGENWGGYISECFVNTEVFSPARSKFFGGFVGRNYHGSVSNSYSTGSVTTMGGNSYGTGGFIGYNSMGKITNSYSICTISAQFSFQYKGGFIGDGDMVSKCFWNTDTDGLSSTSTSNKGAHGKTTLQMYDPNTFISTGWDFVQEAQNGSNDIWFIKAPGETYPQLFWENAVPVADAGQDQYLFSNNNGGATVSLDGNGSFDPDGDALEYYWY